MLIYHLASGYPGTMLHLITNEHGDVRLADRGEPSTPASEDCGWPDVVEALRVRGIAAGVVEWVTGVDSPDVRSSRVDYVGTQVLQLPRSERWREAVSTALLGSWCDPLLTTGRLPATVLGSLKSEARMVHRQLVPVWRRGTRHGRVLSLDADLGGLSLYNLVAADLGLLARTAGGVFADERLNTVLRGLTATERAVVLAYAGGEVTTWTEAAAHTRASAPEAFGERVRRKAKRLAAEQCRRLAQRRKDLA